MKLAAAAAIFISLGLTAWAHRLDEYLQATIISINKGSVQGFMRLVPGVAVSSAVVASIDTNRDGLISETEQHAYAERIFRDLSISIDGENLRPQLASVAFPTTDEMKAGVGEIQIEFNAELPRGGAKRKLVFENRHQSRISAYLVNCLVPQDRNIQIEAQSRNENQSFYRMDYTQVDRGAGWLGFPSEFRFSLWLGAIAFFSFVGLGFLWRKRRGSNCKVVAPGSFSVTYRH